MRFRRLGGQREIEVSLRIVAATNRDLKTLDNSRFREDLYHRLAVFLVNIPPLAERREDISELARGFVTYFAGRVKKRITGISADALSALSTYDFPGNVRELRNIIERAMILTAGPEIEAQDIILPELGLPRGRGKARAEDSFFSMALGADGVPPPAEVVERAYVARVLEHFHGKRVVAAQALGISYPTFLKRLRELGFASET
jgi:two-component system response regulator AtoC